ncbi:MAG: imidazole glycerol phosphate synthase subunit HisH [Anaerolineae bacterium]|nr:MAG: imidazole glycerol phosphate synthase subunit HisH [Anaerolineae bacterium]
MIALVDYGVGNLHSVAKALREVGARVEITSVPEVILQASAVVLPGVGAFGDGMAGLRNRGLITALREVVRRGVPLLGICLGMQLLFQESEERGRHAGLGFLEGRVVTFSPAPGHKVPHTGWNQLWPTRENPLLHGIHSGEFVYFNHGYYCLARPEDTLAETDYIVRYPSVVGKGRVYGIQFHPEKSQRVGLHILRNFVERG